LLASYFEEEKELLRILDEIRARIRETQDHISDSQKKYHTGITPSDFSSNPGKILFLTMMTLQLVCK
jgi:hypothetical protein